MISRDLNEANLSGIMPVVVATSTQIILIYLFRFVDESYLVACAGLLNGFSVLLSVKNNHPLVCLRILNLILLRAAFLKSG